MPNHSTADAEHNTYALAIANAIAAHTRAVRDAPEGTQPGPTPILVPGCHWHLSLAAVQPRWQIPRSDGKAFRFATNIDAVAEVLRTCDNDTPIPYTLTEVGQREAGEAGVHA